MPMPLLPLPSLTGLMPTLTLAGLSLTHCLILAVILFGLGIYGVCSRRNAMIMLLSIEIMLNAANLGALSFARHFEGRAQELAAQRQLLDARRIDLQNKIHEAAADGRSPIIERAELAHVMRYLNANNMSPENALAVGHTGQILSLFVIAIAAAEAAVGLALLIALVRHRDTVDTREIRELRE